MIAPPCGGGAPRAIGAMVVGREEAPEAEAPRGSDSRPGRDARLAPALKPGPRPFNPEERP